MSHETRDELWRQTNRIFTGARESLQNIYRLLRTGTIKVEEQGDVSTGNATVIIDGQVITLVAIVGSGGDVHDPITLNQLHFALSENNRLLKRLLKHAEHISNKNFK